jgi:hypothetical protein
MVTPKKTTSEFDTCHDIDLIAAQVELERRGYSHRRSDTAKAREGTTPAPRAAPAAPPKPTAPAAGPAAPSAGLEQPATEVCSRFQLGDAARSLLQDGQKTRAFLQSLVNAKQFVDAIKVLAHAVAKREAVWWACQCCREGAAGKQPPKILAALEAAEHWAADPTEENRRATYAAAEGAGFDTPAGCAALAAFYSGGSLGPPNVPVIPPGEWLTAHAAAGAIQLAVATGPPSEVAPTYQEFLACGLAVADGANPWKAPPAAAASKPVPNASRAR